MFQFVSADWVQQQLDDSNLLVLDPRSPVRYLAGHLKGAVNLPLAKAFGPDGRLLPVKKLAAWLGAAGLDDLHAPLLYDGADGRNAAMLAWILLYLGCTDVHLMEILLEKWVAESREIFYRPVPAVARNFSARVNAQVRATLEEVDVAHSVRLVDLRSRDEFTGKLDTEGKPGHIPGAVNLVWKELLGNSEQLLAPKEKLRQLLGGLGLGASDHVVAYCRTGVRAAVGYLALAQLGIDVRLYDGSYAEWARSGRPVERTESATES